MRVASGARGLLFLVAVLLLLCGCSTHRQVEKAQKLEDQGRYMEAATVYRQLLPRYASQPKQEALLQARLGDVLLHGGHLQEAFEALQKAAELDPSNVLAHLRLAQLFASASAPENARQHLAVVLEQQPGNAEAHAVMGTVYLSTGAIGKAEQEFQTASSLQPDHQAPAVALAELYSTMGDIERARQVLLRAADANRHEALAFLALGRLEEEQGNVQAAEDAYRSAVRAEDTPETNQRLAQNLFRAARVKEAEEILSHADSQKPQESTSLADFELSSGRGVRASMHYLAALQSRDSSHTAALAARVIEADLDTAEKLSVESLSSGGMEARTELARIHLDAYRPKLDPATLAVLEAEISLVEGDLNKATLKANEAVSQGQDSAAAYFVLGEVNRSKGDAAGALAQWQTALSKDPAYAPALLSVAQAEYTAAKYADAAQKAAAVVRQEPANLNALLLYARILAGSGEYEAARSIAGRALAVARQSAGPHVVLGEIELKQQKAGLALLEFHQALLLDPRSQQALDGLMAVYRHSTLKPQMITRLERSADAPPRSSVMMEIAGRLYRDRRMYDDATRCFRRALEIDRQRGTAVVALAENTVARQSDESLQQLQPLAGRLGGSADALLSAIKAQEEHRDDQAVAGYELALRQGEQTGIAANNLAWLYAQKGKNLDRALELAKLARDHSPANPAVLDTLGFVYLARREYSKAVKVLKEAIATTDATHATIDAETQNSLHQHLAEAIARSGDKGEPTNGIIGRFSILQKPSASISN